MRSTTVALRLAMGAAAASGASACALVSDAGDHTTQVTVTVNASPAEVYRVATDYAHWPTVLADVTAVTIEHGGQRDALVRFRSKALGPVSIQLDNEPDRAIRFVGVDGPSGSRAYGEYRFEPVEGGRTRITATFMLHAGGISGLFVSGSEVARMRRAKLESDLAALARWFARDRG